MTATALAMSTEAAIAQLNERKLKVQTRSSGLTHSKMEAVVRVCQVCLDIGMTYLAAQFAYVLHFHYGLGSDETINHQLIFSYQQVSFGLVTLMFIYAWAHGLYQGTFGSRMDEALRVVRASVLVMLTLLAMLFFYRDYSYSRYFTLILAVSVPMMVGGGRWIFSTLVNRLHAKGYGNRRVIFVGSGDLARSVYSKLLRDPEAGYTAVGYVQCNGSDELKHLLPRLGRLDRFSRILREQDADEVIVALPFEHQQESQAVIRQSVQSNVAVRLLPDVYQYIPEAMSLEVIRGVHVLSPRRSPLSGVNTVIKRAMDIALAVSLLVVLSPVFAMLALLIWLEDRGPVLYAQERVGYKGRTFKILKFRSMRIDAENGSGPVWAKENDPRVTRIGRWLRHLSLDELPQFINVLKGEMSFIGPRPERPAFVEDFSGQLPRYSERHDVKPGLSGWAQVNGLRGNTSIHDRTRYDLFYKDHWSWALELRIYFQTVWELVLRRNAY